MNTVYTKQSDTSGGSSATLMQAPIPFGLMVCNQRIATQLKLLSQQSTELLEINKTLEALQTSADPAVVAMLLDYRWRVTELAPDSNKERCAELLHQYIKRANLLDPSERFRDVLDPQVPLKPEEQLIVQVISMLAWSSRIALFTLSRPTKSELEQIAKILSQPDERSPHPTLKSCVEDSLALLDQRTRTSVLAFMAPHERAHVVLDMYFKSPECGARKKFLEDLAASQQKNFDAHSAGEYAKALESYRIDLFRNLENDPFYKIAEDTKFLQTLKGMFCVGDNAHKSPHLATIHFAAEVGCRAPNTSLFGDWLSKVASVETAAPELLELVTEFQRAITDASPIGQSSKFFRARPPLVEFVMAIQPAVVRTASNFASYESNISRVIAQAPSTPSTEEANTPSTAPDNSLAIPRDDSKIRELIGQVSSSKPGRCSIQKLARVLSDETLGSRDTSILSSGLIKALEATAAQGKSPSRNSLEALTACASALVRSYTNEEQDPNAPRLLERAYTLDRQHSELGFAHGFLALPASKRTDVVTGLETCTAIAPDFQNSALQLSKHLGNPDEVPSREAKIKLRDLFREVLQLSLRSQSTSCPTSQDSKRAAVDAAARMIAIAACLEESDLVLVSRAVELLSSFTEETLLNRRLTVMGRPSASSPHPLVTLCREASAKTRTKIAPLLTRLE